MKTPFVAKETPGTIHKVPVSGLQELFENEAFFLSLRFFSLHCVEGYSLHTSITNAEENVCTHVNATHCNGQGEYKPCISNHTMLWHCDFTVEEEPRKLGHPRKRCYKSGSHRYHFEKLTAQTEGYNMPAFNSNPGDIDEDHQTLGSTTRKVKSSADMGSAQFIYNPGSWCFFY